jgi:DNA-directed RNA polymerase specialized sigma24 family protein
VTPEQVEAVHKLIQARMRTVRTARRLEARERELVRECVGLGVSAGQIGRALGVSRQQGYRIVQASKGS